MMKRLAPLARGLLGSQLLGTAVARYKQELLGEIKVVVRTVVAESLSGASASDGRASGTEQSDGTAAVKLRALPPHAFLGCMEMAFEHLLIVLRRAAAVRAALQRLEAEAGGATTSEGSRAERRRGASLRLAATVRKCGRLPTP